MHLSKDSAELRAIKEDKKRIEDELDRKNIQVDKLEKKLKNLEK